MAVECSTCNHPRIDDIHRAIDAGDGINATAKAFGIAPSTLKLHLRHRAQDAARAAQPRSTTDREASPVEGEVPLDDIEGRIRQLTATADRLRREAESPDFSVRERIAALAECRRTVDTMFELTERLNKGRETEILQSPQWTAVLEVLLDALAPFPEARAAVIEALRAHERS